MVINDNLELARIHQNDVLRQAEANRLVREARAGAGSQPWLIRMSGLLRRRLSSRSEYVRARESAAAPN